MRNLSKSMFIFALLTAACDQAPLGEQCQVVIVEEGDELEFEMPSPLTAQSCRVASKKLFELCGEYSDGSTEWIVPCFMEHAGKVSAVGDYCDPSDQECAMCYYAQFSAVRYGVVDMLKRPDEEPVSCDDEVWLGHGCDVYDF